MTYTTDAYLLTCLTNMHVGVGGANYEVIDNMVQRDAITGMPTVFSSSLKGALREFFKNQLGEENNDFIYIFGTDGTRNESLKGKENIGHFSFFGADLLSMPVRSKEIAYYNATSPFLIKQINEMANSLNTPTPPITFSKVEIETGKPITKIAGQTLEDWKSVGGLTLDCKHIGENIALFNEKDFIRLAKRLPVIARNKLDNGQSKNLWYEEVVPRQSRFVFFVSKPKDSNLKIDFDKILTEQPVQIGANGSIGYGFCTIEKIS